MIKVQGYWISVGDKEPTVAETYVLTPLVELNLRDIVRVVSAGYVGLKLHCFYIFRMFLDSHWSCFSLLDKYGCLH